MAAARPKVACSPATVDEIRRKFAAFQYLEAGELVDELRRQLAGGPRGPEAVAAARELTRLVAEEPRLEERVAIARQALVDLTGDGSEWIVDRDDEIRMQHKMDAERYFSVRVESVLEGVRPADCLSIWREVSLYPEWFPLVTKGAVLSNVHPFEAVLHIISETRFMMIDLFLWGWGCDHSRDGIVLFCVRPTHARDLPTSWGITPPIHPSKLSAFKLLTPTRASASFDILIEPLSETSARFSFQMGQKLPNFVPNWAISYMMTHSMALIFSQMRGVALAMANGDPSCAHTRHVAAPSYKPVATYLKGVVESVLQRRKGTN